MIDNIVMDLVSMIFQEVSVPDHLDQEIVHSEKIGLSLTSGVQFLFDGLYIGPYCYYGNETTSVAPHLLVHIKCCINTHLYIERLVY